MTHFYVSGSIYNTTSVNDLNMWYIFDDEGLQMMVQN